MRTAIKTVAVAAGLALCGLGTLPAHADAPDPGSAASNATSNGAFPFAMPADCQVNVSDDGNLTVATCPHSDASRLAPLIPSLGDGRAPGRVAPSVAPTDARVSVARSVRRAGARGAYRGGKTLNCNYNQGFFAGGSVEYGHGTWKGGAWTKPNQGGTPSYWKEWDSDCTDTAGCVSFAKGKSHSNLQWRAVLLYWVTYAQFNGAQCTNNL